MRRLIGILVAALMAALAISMAIAVAIVLFTDAAAFDPIANGQERARRMESGEDRPTYLTTNRATGLLVRTERDDAAGYVATVEAGWPWPVLSGRLRAPSTEALSTPDVADVEHAVRLRGAIALPMLPNGTMTNQIDRILPLRPNARGLAASTAAIAAILLAIRAAIAIVVRISRRVRRRCSACGYQLAGGDGCPECGRGRAT